MLYIQNTLQKKNSIKFFSTKSSFLNSETKFTNDLSLNKNEIKYLHELNLDPIYRWASRSYDYNRLGEYGNSYELKENLENIIKNLSSSQTYSIMFIIYTNQGFKSINRQILINFDTNIDLILRFLLKRIDLLTSKYGIYYSSTIYFKIRPLYVKLNQPNFNPIKIDKDSSFKPVTSKYLSSKYIPYSMDFKFYGIIVSRDVYLMDGEKLFSFIDMKFDNFFIRNIIDNSFNIYFKIQENLLNYLKF